MFECSAIRPSTTINKPYCFSVFMILATDDIVDGHEFSNEVCCEFHPKKAVFAIHFIVISCTLLIRQCTSVFKLGVPSGSKSFKGRLAYSVTVII